MEIENSPVNNFGQMAAISLQTPHKPFRESREFLSDFLSNILST